MFRLQSMGNAIVGQWQPHRTKPQSIRELLQLIRKVEAFPFPFLFQERILKTLFRRLDVAFIEALAKTRTVKRYQQFRVIAVAMQAFPVIFYDQFPVAGFNDIFLIGYFSLGQFVWSEIGRKFGAHFFNISGCRRAKTNINKATNHGDIYWIESEIFGEKLGRHAAGTQQFSVKVIGPVVVRTGQPLAVSSLSLHKFMAAVPAYIIKPVYLAA